MTATQPVTNPAQPRTDTDPFATFRSLSPDFYRAYFTWHSTGQYEDVREFDRVEDVRARPPARERDDWYAEELRIVDSQYRPLATSRVLEIGCGDGNLTWKLARRCRQVVACDMDPGAVDVTSRRLRDLGITNAQLECRGGAEVRPEDRASYDIVFFVQVLEHVPGWMQGELFDAVFSLVAPGGCLFISTPNRWAIRDTHDTNRLFIHWPPRWIRVPVARTMKWGIRGQDPAWPYPPVLHDYVSFRWMLKRARQAWPGVRASGMSFYPTAEEWLASRSGRSDGRVRRATRRLLAAAGRALPLNYYFGDKVIFSKSVGVEK
jgi:SAM-dependent methyltransferase